MTGITLTRFLPLGKLPIAIYSKERRRAFYVKNEIGACLRYSPWARLCVADKPDHLI